MILLELGRVYIHDGQLDTAKNVLEGVKDNPIMGLWARYYLSIAQLESGDILSAEKNLKQVLDEKPEAFPRAYYHLADIMSQTNNPPMSHYYLGIYYSESMDSKNASLHLKRALDSLEDLKTKEDAKERLDRISGQPKSK